MRKHDDGSHIPLYGDGNEDWEIIKGWHDLDHCREEIPSSTKISMSCKHVRHTYAFWGAGVNDNGEPCQLFYLRDSPGRGRFKVTKVMLEG